MKREYSLRRQEDFRLVFRRGRRQESKLFALSWRKSPLPFTRFAVVTPKAIDKRAVVRNRLRRRAREWLRKGLPFPHSYDLVVVVKKEAKDVSSKVFYEELSLSIGNLRS